MQMYDIILLSSHFAAVSVITSRIDRIADAGIGGGYQGLGGEGGAKPPKYLGL